MAEEKEDKWTKLAKFTIDDLKKMIKDKRKARGVFLKRKRRFSHKALKGVLFIRGIPHKLKNRFKLFCQTRGYSMTQRIIALIKQDAKHMGIRHGQIQLDDDGE